MNGDTAIFSINDRQIGGCFDWEVNLNVCKGLNGSVVKSMTGSFNNFWLYENHEEFMVVLYWVRNGELILADTLKAKIDIPDDYKLGTEYPHMVKAYFERC